MNKVIEEAKNYLQRIPSSVTVEGKDHLLNMINYLENEEQQKDLLMSFILASFYGEVVNKIVFEESCLKHPSKGPHDLVVYLDCGTRIVNEIRRLRQTPWDKYEEENHVFGSINKTRQLYELREDPNHSTTGFLDTILTEIERKSNQLDREEINIIWIASKGLHYQATDIEDAASFYFADRNNSSDNQLGKTHKMPQYLSAIGWFWDDDPINTTKKAECFFLAPLKIDKLKNVFKIKEFYKM